MEIGDNVLYRRKGHEGYFKGYIIDIINDNMISFSSYKNAEATYYFDINDYDIRIINKKTPK